MGDDFLISNIWIIKNENRSIKIKITMRQRWAAEMPALLR